MSTQSWAKGFLASFSALILVISRIIHPYGIQGVISFDDAAFIFLIILTFCLRGFKNYLPKWLIVYFIYRFLNHAFYSTTPYGVINVYLWINFFTFLVLYEDIELRIFIKYYKIVAAICIGFFLIQEFTFHTTGYRVVGIVPFLPIFLEGVDNNHAFINMLRVAERSSSFFSEPAAFVQFLIPLLVIFIFDKNQKKRWLWIVLITASILLSKSGNGLLGLLLISISYLLKVVFKASLKIKILTLFSLLIFGSIFLKIYLNSEIGSEMMARQDEVMEIDEKTSGFYRIFRGFLIFDHYNLSQKIFGVDNLSFIEQMTFQSGYGVYNHLNMYFNAIQHILLRTGYIGLVFFMLFLKNLWKNNNISGKTILLIFFCYMFLTSHYFSSTMFFYLTLAYKFKQLNISQDKITNLKSSKLSLQS